MLKVTNAISYCTVINAFGTYQLNDTIDNSIYRTLSDSEKDNCVSQVISINFDPSVILLDTTSSIIDESTYGNTTINGVSYINNLSFNISPTSTIAIKFYKINPTLDYTYPIVNNTSIVGVTVSNPS